MLFKAEEVVIKKDVLHRASKLVKAFEKQLRVSPRYGFAIGNSLDDFNCAQFVAATLTEKGYDVQVENGKHHITVWAANC